MMHPKSDTDQIDILRDAANDAAVRAKERQYVDPALLELQRQRRELMVQEIRAARTERLLKRLARYR
jgi:hypothetical protein